MAQNSATSKKSRSTAKPRSRSTKRSKASAPPSAVVPRATSGYDEDDVLLSGGGGHAGVGFGRCGGRMLSSKIEQTLCDRLSGAGITHSHSPRHFEVQVKDDKVAAYAPMIVLRGRGREGKTVVIEATESVSTLPLEKIVAFRTKLGVEFYVIFVAPEDVLDEVPITAYDESCTTADLSTLIGRLSD